MKHKLKNIAKFPMPIGELKAKPGEIVEAELTPKIEYLIKNNFFEDLGWSPHAFDLEGACRVNLYTNSSCKELVALPLIADISDIGTTGLISSEINCISVEN